MTNSNTETILRRMLSKKKHLQFNNNNSIIILYNLFNSITNIDFVYLYNKDFFEEQRCKQFSSPPCHRSSELGSWNRSLRELDRGRN